MTVLTSRCNVLWLLLGLAMNIPNFGKNHYVYLKHSHITFWWLRLGSGKYRILNVTNSNNTWNQWRALSFKTILCQKRFLWSTWLRRIIHLWQNVQYWCFKDNVVLQKRCMQQKDANDCCLPKDFIEQQRAYFEEIDKFELPVEEV